MLYSTNKSKYFTVVRTLAFGVTCDNISPCDYTVGIMYFYNPGRGSILVSGMVGSVTHGPYCDSRLQFFAMNSLLLFCITYFTIHCMFLTSLFTCEGLGMPLSSPHPVSINWLWLWCQKTVALISVGGSERYNKSQLNTIVLCPTPPCVCNWLYFFQSFTVALLVKRLCGYLW